MAKKIDKEILEALRIKCYEVALGEHIDSETMTKVKDMVRSFLDKNGYKINYVKCDLENNPPSVIDAGELHIDISEEVIPGSSESKIFTLVL